jgi:hypothetical protein
MAYRVVSTLDDKWQPRKGLEGPFRYPSGQVLYYDPKEGQYWDPTTDFYVSYEDANRLQSQIFDLIKG